MRVSMRRADRAGDSRSLRIVCTIAKAAYGYVGGTQDNHVVQALVSFFCDAGLHVATYDTRGVGSSGGRMTWTMRAESRDYQTVVDAMAARVETHGTPELYLCVRRPSYAGIQRGCDPVRCESSPRASTAEAPKGWETAQVRYVLLAYPLGVRWALTCLSGNYFQHAIERVVERAATEPNVAALVLTTTADQFTSAAVRRPSHAVLLHMDYVSRIYAQVQRPAYCLASAGPLFCVARGARRARRRAPRMVH